MGYTDERAPESARESAREPESGRIAYTLIKEDAHRSAQTLARANIAGRRGAMIRDKLSDDERGVGSGGFRQHRRGEEKKSSERETRKGRGPQGLGHL